MPHATVSIPLGALHCLELLWVLTGPAGYLLLPVDKGVSNPATYACGGEPDIHVRGSFSMMVNFHALQLWVKSHGGDAMVSEDDDVSV